MNSGEIQSDYRANELPARSFLAEFLHQFSALIATTEVKLGVPLEGRVKEWSSLAQKLDRKALEVKSCREVEDLIGIRAITLFERDATVLCALINKTFSVKSREDKAERLERSHFGYLSRHFIVGLPKAWKKVPAFHGIDFNVEIQVRTLSQHIWATASHLLQYKKEADVPSAVARSIHRVAALLETVDLEFERVLDQRDLYSKSRKAVELGADLDADNVKILLDAAFPAANKLENELYSELLTDLKEFGITTIAGFNALVEKRKLGVMELEQQAVEENAKPAANVGNVVADRVAKGVYYSHVGLARGLLMQEFGKKWTTYRQKTPPVEVGKKAT